MKKIIVVLTLTLLAISCGTEEAVTQYAPQDNLVSNVALRQKVMRMAQHPTAIDNIIDGSDCFSIKMPYLAYVNNDEVYITTEDDYQQVYDIFAASDDDLDFVTILTPITVVYADYSEETFVDILAFEDAKSACSAQAELSCIGLTYPIGIKTYNSENILAESYELGTKKALYDFLRGIDGYDAAAFSYPLPFHEPDENIAQVTNNQALEDAIDSYTEECLSQFYQPATVSGIIIQGTWYVSYYHNDTDLTANYQGLNFAFTTDFTIDVTGAGQPISGSWGFVGEGQDKVTFSFDDATLDPLGGEWTVINFWGSELEFQKEATGVEAAKYLRLTKN